MILVLKVMSSIMQISEDRVQLVAGGVLRMRTCLVPGVSSVYICSIIQYSFNIHSIISQLQFVGTVIIYMVSLLTY